MISSRQNKPADTKGFTCCPRGLALKSDLTFTPLQAILQVKVFNNFVINQIFITWPSDTADSA